MKQLLGQYGKVIILMLVVLPILTFLLSTGEGSFASKMPEPTSKYQDQDNSVLVSDIAKRQPPTVVIKDMKMKNGQTYNFSSSSFVDYYNQDGNKNNTTLEVKKVINKDGLLMENPSAGFKAKAGFYRVTYQVTEIYKDSKRVTTKDAKFICD